MLNNSKLHKRYEQIQSTGYSNLHKIKYIGLSPSGKATDFDSVTRGFESRQPSHEKSTRKRAFLGEVRLSAREVMLRIVKLLRGEVSLDMKKAPFGVLFSMIYASRMKRR